MAEDIMLVLIHGGETVIKRARQVESIDDLKLSIRGKWVHLSNVELVMFYSVGKYTNCVLKDGSDYESMLLMCDVVNEKCVDVEVNRCVDSSSSDKSRHVGPNHQKQFPITDTSNVSVPVSDEAYNVFSSFDFSGLDTPPVVIEQEFAPPAYDVCPDIQPVPCLSKDWDKVIKGVGQAFRGGREEFKLQLIKYSSKIGFEFKFDKNNARYVYVSCKAADEYDCKWFIRGKHVPETGCFIITKCCLEHGCGGKIVSNKTARIGPKIWSELVLENVRSKPTHPGTDMMIHMKLNYGFQEPYYKAWRSVDAARSRIYGSFSKSYDQLRWYCEALLRTNPGSIAFVNRDERSKRFTNAFFSFKACLDGFKSCRPMLFIDATFMHGKTKACILSAIGKDGNNGLFPVAFTLVMGETLENWRWFLELIKKHVQHEQKIFYVSDRNGGLLSAFSLVWEEPNNFFCLYHLHNNLKAHYSGNWSTPHREKMCALLTDCAYAPNLRIFWEKVAIFLLAGGALAQTFLDGIPFDKWVVAFAPDVMRYGEMTSNAAESFNKWILFARSLPVCYMVDTIRSDVMRWFVERRARADKWSSILCTKRQDIWNYHVELSRTWFVLDTPTTGMYEVKSKTSCVVNLRTRECTCSQWQIHGFPCSHAAAVIQKHCNNIKDVVEKFFFVHAYKECYSSPINPIPDTERFDCKAYAEPESILPPVKKKTPGRPCKKRKRSYGEVPRAVPKKCPSCGLLSRHDPLTCINNGGR